jgi:hypothetical protein
VLSFSVLGGSVFFVLGASPLLRPIVILTESAW